MTPDYRALCAELTNGYEHELNKSGLGCALIQRARAALAQPEPVAPTDAQQAPRNLRRERSGVGMGRKVWNLGSRVWASERG